MQTKRNGKTFEVWMSQVNAEVQRKTGLHTDDLTDISYMEMWEDGVPPARAARRAIKNSGGEG